ncbi:MAG: GNAT family N-acetyltransferase [Legionella sp.]|nr:GNAT family N-acetyltransferase [Legionella sp.]
MKEKKHTVNPSRHSIVFHQENSLQLSLETDRLIIQSIKNGHKKACHALFADPITMEKFGTGQPFDHQKTKTRLKLWLNAWQSHDPFSGYAIHLKNDAKTFIGVIVLEHSRPGEAEVSYVLDRHFWGKGYGSEATDAIFQSLIPRIMLRGYSVENRSLDRLVATARLDNPASQKVLKGVGFKEEKVVHKFGAWRQSYGLPAKQIRNDYHHFFDKKDKRLYREEEWLRLKNDSTALELATSAFGTAFRK